MAALEVSIAPTRASPFNANAAVQIAAILVAFATFLFVPQVLNDGDTYWHLAAGRWMVEHHQVLRQDLFSSTYAGHRWVTFEWLSEVLMALAFNLAGWTGLLLLFATAAGATSGMVAQTVGRSLGALSLAVTLILSLAVLSPGALARPHMLAAPVLALWTLELLAAREASRGPRLWMAAVMLLWANLHGSYAFGAALYGAFALEALALSPGRRVKAFRDWAVPGVLIGAALLATPNGLATLKHPFYVMSQTTLADIVEWRPMDFSKPHPFEAGLLTVLFVGLSRGVKVPAWRLLLILGVTHMALQQQRHQLLAAIVIPMMLAKPFAEALGQQAVARASRGPAAAALALGMMVLVAVRFALPPAVGDWSTRPASALAHTPQSLLAQPVLNSYGFGGYLILAGGRPFIDGRADMYGDAFMNRYDRIMSGDRAALRAAVDQYGVTWTLLMPGEALIGVMDSEPGWRRVYSDRYAVVHVRDPARP